ncbi:MAG: TorF family putative porin [Pseudomonadota bacterium]
MRKTIFAITAAGVALTAPAHAQEAAQTPAQVATPGPAEPATGFDLSVGVTGTSDYRFRGLSQSNKRPALQGTVGVTHSSGFYVGTWASTISNYVANGSPAEVDLYGGFKKTTEGGTTFDVGLLYYWYPDSDGITSDFFEPYANVSTALGPVTAKVGGNFAWKQNALGIGAGRESAFYGYGDLSGAVGPVTLTGHVGRSFNENYITFGTKYTDWSLTAAYTAGPATFSVGYVDTNKKLFSYPAGGGKNRDIAKAGVVASVAVAF